MEIVSLPVGGRITFIACGKTIRCITWSRVMPRGMAIPIATTVSSRGSRIPALMSRWKRNVPTTPQCMLGAVTRVYTASAATATTSTADNHRHGCRTGIALIASGRRPACELGSAGLPEAISVTSTYVGHSVRRHAGRTDRVVVVQRHIGAGDGAVRHIPVLEDVGVVAVVVDQVLERVRDRLLERAALDHGDAVRRDAARLSTDLELAVGLLDLVVGHGLVEPSEIGAAAGQGGVRLGLRAEAQHLDVLAGRAVVLLTRDRSAADGLPHVAPAVALLARPRLHGPPLPPHAAPPPH